MTTDKRWNLFYQLINGERCLKEFHQVVTYLLQFTDNHASSAEDLAQIIGGNTLFANKVLTLVNSPAFGFPKRVGDLSEAISILGYEQVRDILFIVSILEQLRTKREEQTIRLWKHSFFCAKTCEILAQSLGKPVESAFAFGFLHDIGKILLCYSNPRAVSSVLNNYKYHQGKIEHWQSETQVLGMTHAEIGGFATLYWKLPEVTSQVIWNHHFLRTENLKTTEEVFSQIVRIADRLSWTVGFPSVNSVNPFAATSFDVCASDLLTPLGITKEGLQEVVLKVRKIVGKSQTVFNWFESGKQWN